jgi:hypothetical protein
MNVEHRTSNIEHRIKTRERENGLLMLCDAAKTLAVGSKANRIPFLDSMLSGGRWTFKVRLFLFPTKAASRQIRQEAVEGKN